MNDLLDDTVYIDQLTKALLSIRIRHTVPLLTNKNEVYTAELVIRGDVTRCHDMRYGYSGTIYVTDKDDKPVNFSHGSNSFWAQLHGYVDKPYTHQAVTPQTVRDMLVAKVYKELGVLNG